MKIIVEVLKDLVRLMSLLHHPLTHSTDHEKASCKTCQFSAKLKELADEARSLL